MNIYIYICIVLNLQFFELSSIIYRFLTSVYTVAFVIITKYKSP